MRANRVAQNARVRKCRLSASPYAVGETIGVLLEHVTAGLAMEAAVLL